ACSSPIRCARHEKDFFLLGASSSVWDFRLIVGRRKMLAENVNRALAGYKEKRLVIRKWLLSLRCDCITMVQPAESRQGLNLAFSPASISSLATYPQGISSTWRCLPPNQVLKRTKNSLTTIIKRFYMCAIEMKTFTFGNCWFCGFFR